VTGRPLPSDAALARIRQFALVLEQAVGDATLERLPHTRIVHLWDDDSLYLPLRGFLALEEAPKYAREDMVAQALFSSGFLGPVGLLAPHRSELLAQIASWAHERPPKRGPGLKARAQTFLRRPEVSVVQRIADQLAGLEEVNEAVIESALEQLRGLDPRSFVFVESLWGDWMQRVNRLIDDTELLDMSLYGPPTESLLDGAAFTRLAELLSQQRSGNRPLSTAIDAAALAALAGMTDDVRGADSQLHPRFFTSSPALKRLYDQDPWMREQLTYPTESSLASVHSVWRGGMYYVLRALFPALHLGGSKPPDEDETSLADLERLSIELNDALGSGSGAAVALLNDYKFEDDSSLAELVNDLESSRMSRIWLRYSSGDAKNVVESLRAINRVEDADKEHKVAEAVEDRFFKRLHSELADRRLCVQMVDAIDGANGQLERASREGYLSLKNDLAVVRWGVSVDEERDKVTLRADAGSDAYRELLQVYDIDYLRRDVRVAERTIAILLGLDRFDLAGDVLAAIGDEAASEPLVLMSMVANLGSRRSFTEDQLHFAIKLLQSRWNTLAEPERRTLALGYGYAAFAAWARSVQGGAWGMTHPHDRHGWARWSIDIVYDRLTDQDEWPLIYGVNHVVYVATRAELEVPGLDGLAQDLENIAARTDEFRFLDTVGYRLLRDAQNDVANSRVDVRDLAENKLERSLKYLGRAAQIARSDVEIRQHLELAEDMRRRLAAALRK
jgi:hypothetical protein